MENNSENEALERYLTGQMTPEEEAAFEVVINSSPSLREFLQHYEALDQWGTEESWPMYEVSRELLEEKQPLFDNPETLAFLEKVKAFRKDNPSRPARIKIRRLWFAIGSAAAVLLLLWAVFPHEKSMQELYLQHNSWNEVPSLTAKGDSMEALSFSIETQFTSRDYEKVIATSQMVPDSLLQQNIPMLLYVGISHMELNDFDTASAIFEHIITSKTLDFHKGYWYQSLLYLKKEDKVACREVLQKIIMNPGYYKYKEAMELWKELGN
ncbi:MAG: hypothetical protein R2786_02295 [Flavobacteriaceae bacterium]